MTKISLRKRDIERLENTSSIAPIVPLDGQAPSEPADPAMCSIGGCTLCCGRSATVCTGGSC